jgi:hypothetical protein
MSLFSKLYGTVSNFFQIGGPTGPGWYNDDGYLDARNSTNSAFVNVRGADPIANNDLVTKEYGDAHYGSGSGSGVFIGTSIINFGVFPGASDASVNVIGQTGIVGTSVVTAWLYPSATVEHSADEHRVEQIDVYADGDSIIPGVGFTIYARTRNDRLYGEFYVGWLWSTS